MGNVIPRSGRPALGAKHNEGMPGGEEVRAGCVGVRVDGCERVNTQNKETRLGVLRSSHSANCAINMSLDMKFKCVLRRQIRIKNSHDSFVSRDIFGTSVR